MKRLIILLIFTSILFGLNVQSQSDSDKKADADIKTGWNIGALPVVSYNSDLGFQYGALSNLYNYGDGSTFPKYRHSFYAEASRYTRGAGIIRLFYDSEFLIPGVRVTADLAYLPDPALDFFGFNGYDAIYNSSWQDQNHANYKSRLFYNHERDILRFKIDLQTKTFIDNLNFAFGYNFMDISTGPVNVEELNKGRDPEDKLPDISLYQKYIDWGIIDPSEAEGDIHNNFLVGFVYDTRDNEPCPMNGIWTEAVIFNSFSKNFNFGKFAFTHRQYFTIIENDLSFAYRLGYQSIVYGDAPFYLYPYMVYTYMPSSSVDGLGGGRTVRGMIRNRAVGDGVAYANIELRYKFTRFRFLGQNWYLAISPFLDVGMVTEKIELNLENVPDDIKSDYFNKNAEKPHFTYGSGFRAAMNENFVIAADVGVPINPQDGKFGLYIGMNWLF